MSAATGLALTPEQRILLIASSLPEHGCFPELLFAVARVEFRGVADERLVSELRALAGHGLVALCVNAHGRDVVKITPAGVRLADAMLPALPAALASLGAS